MFMMSQSLQEKARRRAADDNWFNRSLASSSSIHCLISWSYILHEKENFVRSFFPRKMALTLDDGLP
jgi:hypothetical protein